MKPKTMILMGVAIVFGLAAAYLTNLALKPNENKAQIYVARDKLGRWVALKDLNAQLEAVEVLEKDVPTGAVKPGMEKEILNRMLIRPLEKGDRLTLDCLQSKDKGGLEIELTAGKRAMAVRITQDSAVGGFVLPGSHVDVLHSSRDGQRGESKVILENIKVMAIDLLPVRPDDRPGITGSTATLEVSPTEALKLAAVRDSLVTLVLRPYDDKTMTPEEDVDPSKIAPPPPPPEKKVEVVTVPTPVADKPKPPDPDEVHVVTIVNGGAISERVYVYDKNGRLKHPSELKEIAKAPNWEAKAPGTGMPDMLKAQMLNAQMSNGDRSDRVPAGMLDPSRLPAGFDPSRLPGIDPRKLPPLESLNN